MTIDEQRILVLPRKLVENNNYALRWADVEQQINELEVSSNWVPRSLAEVSDEWVQPIPVALLKDEHHRYCILRRIRSIRPDMNGRLTVVVGGHVEYCGRHMTFMELLESTMRRELSEEIGIDLDGELEPLGVLFDPSSINSSRHLAFVFETEIAHGISSRAPEEFAKKSKYSGRFLSAEELSWIHRKLDPWSALIVENFIDPSLAFVKGWQGALPFR